MTLATPSPVLAPRRPADPLGGGWATMVDGLLEPAMLVDRQGRLLHANQPAQRIAAQLAGDALAVAQDGGRRRVRVTAGEQPAWFDLTVSTLADGALYLATARDATLEQNLRDALIESRQRFRDLVEMSSDFAWETDLEGRFVFVSHDEVLGFPTPQMIGRRPADFMVDPQMDGMPLPFGEDQPIDATEFWAIDAEGRSHCLLTVARPFYDAQGHRSGTRGMCRDVTEERLREADLAQAVQGASVLGHILSTMREAIEPGTILESACNAIVPALSAQGCRLYRARPDGALTAVVSLGSAPEGLDEAMLAQVSTQDGNPIAAEARYRRHLNGKIVLWREPDAPAWTASDRALLAKVADQLGVALAEIAERELLERLSSTDPLTELLNRRAFAERLKQRVLRAQGGGEGGALLYVDLDNFKQINDRAGHERGDAALKAVATLLSGTARPTDLVARVGGDEFALWLEGADREGAEARGARLLEAMAAMREYDTDPAKPFGMTIGGAIYDCGSDEGAEALVGRADAAMYEGKRGGKGRLTLASPAAGAPR